LASPDRALHLPLGVSCGDRLPLVVLPLAAGEADLDLGSVAHEVEPERDQRIALLPDLADQARDLAAMEQQLASPLRLVLGDARLGLRRHVTIIQPSLVVLDPDEAVAKVRPTAAERFDLGPQEPEAGLVRPVDAAVMKGPAIGR